MHTFSLYFSLQAVFKINICLDTKSVIYHFCNECSFIFLKYEVIYNVKAPVYYYVHIHSR